MKKIIFDEMLEFKTLRGNILNFLIAFIIFLLSPLISFAYTQSNSINMSSSQVYGPAGAGFKIQAKLDGISINSITKTTNSNPTKAFLLNSSCQNIKSATFSGDTATFSTSTSMASGTIYYIIASSTANFNGDYSGAVSYPIENEAIRWLNNAYILTSCGVIGESGIISSIDISGYTPPATTSTATSTAYTGLNKSEMIFLFSILIMLWSFPFFKFILSPFQKNEE